MNLEEKYPKLFEKLEDKEIELRHLLNVDENYEDFDSEEYEFDFEEYNYVIYIAEPIQQALGAEKMDELMVKLHDKETFVNFLASEKDLYGVKSDLSTQEIISLVLEQVEEIA
ncbi:hypothetical protein MNB_SV-3-722 [hydrothermal vent metagenome]|uniref:Uncharacterized protein n=1 Tax=hydrothermal vent metagenome TaxID=652676 RepID=A0A1W1BBW4_9ZZZZ